MCGHELCYRDLLVSTGGIFVFPNRVFDGLFKPPFDVVGDVLLDRCAVDALMGVCDDVQVRLFPAWQCSFLRQLLELVANFFQYSDDKAAWQMPRPWIQVEDCRQELR